MLVSGCSSTDPARRSDTNANDVAVVPQAIGAIPQIDQVAGLTLPLDAYRITAEHRQTIRQAEAILVDQCMRPFGFSRTLPSTSESPPADRMSRRYGITGADTAARWGYHLPDGSPRPNRPAASDAMSPDYLLVWTGSKDGRPQPGAASGSFRGKPIPPGGCAGAAARQLGLDRGDGLGDGLGDARLSDVDFAMFGRSKADPRVDAVLRSWSECMAAKGYKYPDPFAAAGAFNIVSSPPTPAEVRTAVADVACKSETNLIGVWHTVETAYQNAAVQQYLAELTAIKSRADQAVGKAIETVAAGSSSR